MASRPYFNKSITELEALFERSGSDEAALIALKNELQFRNTQRSVALKQKVLASVGNASNLPSEQKSLVFTEKAEPRVSEKSSAEPKTPEIAKANLGRDALGPKPSISNAPQSILSAWTALEVLSPQGFKRETDLTAGDRSRIARFDERDLPWELGEKSRPKKRLYYELILGAIELSPAVEALLKLYADNRPDQPSMKGFSPIASVLLDKDGKPLDDDTPVAISSFAWGVPIALQGNLRRLADWPSQEGHLIAALRKRLIKRDRNDEFVSITKNQINDLFDHLVHALNLKDHAIKAPYFAIRRFEFFANKTPPEPGLLNSFFLEDLALARSLEKTNKLPNALEHYLGVKRPPKQTNLLEDDAGLANLLQPALSSLGRWPGKGRYPLALLQQAAVNASQAQLMQTGVLAVNGPPGTGKTTLLRDVVAARIVERATIMSEYKRPAAAFKATQQVLQRSGAKITLHTLDNRLKGFEMVVASSNNKAVENVSAELPALDAVADDAPDLKYFKSISDQVLDRETWGAISAVLGNSSNRYSFSQSFWRDQENGLSTYLNHASGIPQTVSEPQESGPAIKRNRKIVDSENPPANAREASQRWEKARSEFLNARKVSSEAQEKLQEIHEYLLRIVQIASELEGLRTQLLALEVEVEAQKSLISAAEVSLRSANSAYDGSEQDLLSHLILRPGLFSRIFRTNRFRIWRAQHEQKTKAAADLNRIATKARSECAGIQAGLSSNQNLADSLVKRSSSIEAEAAHLRTQIEHSKIGRGLTLPDDDFFAQTHEKIQTANVWFNDAAHRLRDNVFEKAMALHRAFIDGAADPLRQNLSVFVESFGTRSLGTTQKDDLISDLWASFFLVVPVVSTTFASVHRMFARLPSETLGWLLVDEAGQALPQAAVGAMIRTKNSVVVGDPLQIEPVVTLPNSLTEEICGYFGIDALKYNAPEASVQTVADAASMYCARFPIGSGHRDVGAPLLVHRRCDSPMFDISNEIAYANLMVQAKRPSEEEPVLGPSSWVDVVGKPGPDKWCGDEAVTLIDMLHMLRNAGADPDIYIVTPFVIVQNNLRQELLKSGVLEGWVGNPNAWVWEHVGTVHTVQGREAEIVFFVLGAQAASQNGARSWAGGRPNLVNVAVTRAKTSLYVIGNRSLWKNSGVFSTLDQLLAS